MQQLLLSHKGGFGPENQKSLGPGATGSHRDQEGTDKSPSVGYTGPERLLGPRRTAGNEARDSRDAFNDPVAQRAKSGRDRQWRLHNSMSSWSQVNSLPEDHDTFLSLTTSASLSLFLPQ